MPSDWVMSCLLLESVGSNLLIGRLYLSGWSLFVAVGFLVVGVGLVGVGGGVGGPAAGPVVGSGGGGGGASG